MEFVVPELQKRGRYRTAYEGSTLRGSLFGEGRKYVDERHPAAKYRGAYAGKPSAADTPARDFLKLALEQAGAEAS